MFGRDTEAKGTSAEEPAAVERGTEEAGDRAKATRLSHWLLQSAAPAQAKEDAGGGAPPAVVSEAPTDAGTKLPKAVRGKMEGSLGADFSDVRVHQSDQVAASGAKAVAQGSDIHMAPGQYDPHSTTGQELLGHELAHVVQQRAGRVSAGEQGKDAPFTVDDSLEGEADRAGAAAARGERVELPGADAAAAPRSAAQPKLMGTHAAMRNNGGKGGAHGSSWESILHSVKSYESLERKAMRENPLSGPTKNKLLAQLSKVEAKCKAYLRNPAHKQSSDEAFQRMEDRSFAEITPENPKPQIRRSNKGEGVGKAGRKQETVFFRYGQVKMLLKRVRLEQQEILNGEFSQRQGFADTRITAARNDAVGGQVNKLDEVEYGDDKGYFKPDKSGESPGDAARQRGIRAEHANLGSRSVAMSRLDSLLGGGVNARTEFATHQGNQGMQQGTYQQKAEGIEAGKASERGKLLGVGQEREDGDNTSIDLADPELQRQLNILQIIDAIAGQTDRHWGNYFIKVDEQGRVTKVTGIDLDMAFGKQHESAKADDVGHYRGLPMMVDKAFATKLATISDDDIKGVLGPLLSKSELAATMKRWKEVKTEVAKAPKVTDWNATTAMQQTKDDSYLGNLRQTDLITRVETACEQAGNASGGYSQDWMFKILPPIKAFIADNPAIRADQVVLSIDSAFAQLTSNPSWKRLEASAAKRVGSQTGEDAPASEDDKARAARNMLRKSYADWAVKNIKLFLNYLLAHPNAKTLPAPPPPVPPTEWIPERMRK